MRGVEPAIVGRLRAPDGFRIEIDRIGKERYRFVYAERCPNKRVRERTFRLMARTLPPTCVAALDDDCIRLSGELPLETISDMMIGEFLPWSAFGTQSLGTLFAMLARKVMLP